MKVVLTRAYTNSHVKTAKRLLQDLARRLDTDYPSAATSVREGLDETLTVLGLGLSERLQRSLATTNAIESLLSRTRHVQRHGETLARRDDGAALGGRRGARSGEGVPSGARMSRYARAGRCPPGTRRAVRTRGVVRDGCVVVNQAAAEFQQLTGHPPPVGLIADAILGAVYGHPQRQRAVRGEKLNENLERFFAGKRRREATSDRAAVSSCC